MGMWGWLLKTAFYRGAGGVPLANTVRAQKAQVTAHQSSKPQRTHSSPKKRICPSCSLSISVNMRRHADGAMKGIMPSKISTSASAGQSRSLMASDAYLPAPRMALKNSDDGSTTITSDLLPKLDLYASRLR